MPRTLIRDLNKKVGEKVTIEGWVSVQRRQGKNLIFFDFRDRTGTVQGVVVSGPEVSEGVPERAHPESIVKVEASVVKRPEKNINSKIQNGDIELQINSMTLLYEAHDLPFERGAEVNLDTYLDNQPYTLRSERSKEVFKLQETIIDAFRASMRTQDFVEFQAPAIVGGDAEGGAAAFEVGYHYGQPAFLATSPQFYKQIMVGVYERAFATPKVFRGEKHATPRHLNEYSSMDFEMGFINDHTDVMKVLENAIRAIVLAVSANHDGIFERFNSEPVLLPDNIPVLKLREAQKILGADEAPDLEPEQEKQLCEWSKKEHKSDFVFVTHYPVSKRPFYTYEDENDKGFTKSFDLLFRGLEITTGGQRVHDYDALVEKIKAKGLDPKKFSFYLQAFKVGMPPHGGSATGLERLTARMLNLPNVKEATLFPRDLNRIDTLLSTDKKE